jgi:hypothetical protein
VSGTSSQGREITLELEGSELRRGSEYRGFLAGAAVLSSSLARFFGPPSSSSSPKVDASLEVASLFELISVRRNLDALDGGCEVFRFFPVRCPGGWSPLPPSIRLVNT